jgi:RNA polymerase sigma-70 factor, ECF subfamily
MSPLAQRPRSGLPNQGAVRAPSVAEERSDEDPVQLDPAIRDQVLATVPSLRAFAISLCGNIDRGDDLVQETLLRAFTYIESFQPGTNMAAWLFTILRNHFRDDKRKRQREVEDADGHYAETLISHPEQTARIEFEELRAALAKLPAEQREALILVGASDFSYSEAAAICGCPAGTIKSRVSRARVQLADLLAIDAAAGAADLVGLPQATLWA